MSQINKRYQKIILIFTSILAVFFLTAQSCSFAGVSTGLSADCVGTGDIVCDGDSAYECELASYGSGFYVSRASEFDVEYCGAVEQENQDDNLLVLPMDTDGDSVADDSDLCEGFDDAVNSDTDMLPDGCDYDLDGDGYSNMMEVAAGSDPEDGTNFPSVRGNDHDGDGLDDSFEEMYGFDSTTADEDGDGILDAEEDFDLDGLKNEEEYMYGTDPTNPDMDADTYPDGFEVLIALSNPLDAASLPAECCDWIDNDGDGVSDSGWCTRDSINGDSDCENELDDSEGVAIVDVDADGVVDSADLCEGFDDALDLDFDSIPDGCDLDLDGDEYFNMMEIAAGSDPKDIASIPSIRDDDGDGMPNAWEKTYGFNPAKSGDASIDTDGDGLINGDEYRSGTNPLEKDSDGDTVSDNAEIEAGTDPMDESSYPSCFDSDGGQEYYTPGELKLGTVTYYDYCFDNDLHEFYCNGDDRDDEFYDCTLDGAVCDHEVRACVVYMVEPTEACVSDQDCASATCYNSVCVTEKPFTATEITGVEFTHDYLPLSSALSFYYYDDLTEQHISGLIGKSATDGTYTQYSVYEPTTAKPIMIGVPNRDWYEINGWPYGIIESDNAEQPSEFLFFMRKVTNSDVDTTFGGYLLFYVSESGATYYATANHDFTGTSGGTLLAPEEALQDEHLAQAAP